MPDWRYPPRIDYRVPKIIPLSRSVAVHVDAHRILAGRERPVVWLGAAGTEQTATGGRRRAEWPGAIVQKSYDGGISWLELARVRTEATFGFAIQALAAGSTSGIDETSTLRVKTYRDRVLTTISEAAMLNGGNLAAVGSDARGWELINFRTVTPVQGVDEEVGVWDEYTGSYQTPLIGYDLTGLLRGRFGTGHLVAGHAIGDRFVLLDPAMVAVDMADADRGLEIDWRAVTIGASQADLRETRGEAGVFVGRSVLAMAPVDIQASRVPSTGVVQDLAITWTPQGLRSAYGATVVPGEEGITEWQIDALSASGAVLRTLTTAPTGNGSAVDSDPDAAAATYDHADLVLDLGDELGLALPLTNPGAESGDLTGWSAGLGSFAAVASRAEVYPYAGFRLFTPASNAAEHTISQTIELLTVPGFDPDWLDGNTTARASAAQVNMIAGDTAQVIVRAIDADGTTVLASQQSSLQEIAPTGVWDEVATPDLTLPAAARFVRVELRAVRVGTADAGIGFDAVTLRLGGRVGPVRVRVYPVNAFGRGVPGEAWV